MQAARPSCGLVSGLGEPGDLRARSVGVPEDGVVGAPGARPGGGRQQRRAGPGVGVVGTGPSCPADPAHARAKRTGGTARARPAPPCSGHAEHQPVGHVPRRLDPLHPGARARACSYARPGAHGQPARRPFTSVVGNALGVFAQVPPWRSGSARSWRPAAARTRRSSSSGRRSSSGSACRRCSTAATPGGGGCRLERRGGSSRVSADRLPVGPDQPQDAGLLPRLPAAVHRHRPTRPHRSWCC